MLRIYLNNERMSLGSTGITIVQSQWDREKERVKGRHTEALNTNLQLITSKVVYKPSFAS